MPFIPAKQILEAKRMDLLTWLRNYDPEELVHVSGNEYKTRSHDSLRISGNGLWNWFSQGYGGRSALDYLVKVKGKTFTEAVELIIGRAAAMPPVSVLQAKEAPRKLLLPERCESNDRVLSYLTGRGIDAGIVRELMDEGLIYESSPGHNAVFVGRDKEGVACYAAWRATTGERMMGEASGSDKRFSFRLVSESNTSVHLFESAIDLLSYATIAKEKNRDWRGLNLLSLGGVFGLKHIPERPKLPAALDQYLLDYPGTDHVKLHLDNDTAGRMAARSIAIVLDRRCHITNCPPPSGKDVNDYLCTTHRMKIRAACTMER